MSSLGGQWRVLRHLLSANNLNAEVEKLVHKMKPGSRDQWDSILQRLEKILTARLVQARPRPETAALEPASSTAPAITDKHDTAPADKETVVNEVPVKVEQRTESVVVREESSGGLWGGLRIAGRTPEPAWKNNKSVTKSSVHARTSYVIGALVAAGSGASLARRADAFVDHLHAFPEARDLAVKEGAVRALLRAQERLRGDDPASADVAGALKEALALVGWAGAPGGLGPRVLSLDGGGIRGLIAIELLRELERLAGAPLHRLFDYIIGVSTGAIIAAVVGSGVGTLETASTMYHTLSKEMFGNTSLIGGTSRLVWTHSYYDTAAWEKMLRDNLGDITLSRCNRRDAPKLALVSCVGSPGARLSPFVFRSYSAAYRRRSAYPGTARARLWQAVRASAAAPTYFHEFTLDGLVHQDGGIMVNNPAGVGLHEARLVWGVSPAALVSVGTGRAPAQRRPHHQPAQPQSTSWKDKFNKILDSATDTEGVHLLVNDLVPAGRYFRFNPPLLADCAMDEVDPHKLQAMLEDTRAYMRRNHHKLSQAAALLAAPRPPLARLQDYVTRRATVLGLHQP